MITKAPCVRGTVEHRSRSAGHEAFGDWSHSGATADETLYGKNTIATTSAITRTCSGCRLGSRLRGRRWGYENFIFGFLAGAVDFKVDFASGTSTKFSGGNRCLRDPDQRPVRRRVAVGRLPENPIRPLDVVYIDGGQCQQCRRPHRYGLPLQHEEQLVLQPLATVDAVWTDFRKLICPALVLTSTRTTTRTSEAVWACGSELRT